MRTRLLALSWAKLSAFSLGLAAFLLGLTAATAITQVALAEAAFAKKASARSKCDLPKWRELSHEASVLKSHPGVAKRDGNSLKILLEDGKSVDFVDRHEGDEPGAAYELHRVISVGPKNEWVVVFEPGSDSFGYRVIHRKSGKVEELAGCPIWSKDGRYFAAIHEDLESGKTSNEASLWFCAEPADSCSKIWNAPEGGHDAQWSGALGGTGSKSSTGASEKVRITLSKIDMDRPGQPVVIQVVQCAPKQAKPNCIQPKTWKKG